MHSRYKDTKLHDAVREGKVKIVDKLLARGNYINDKGLLEQTPLHIAAQNNNVEMIIKLLAAGALCDVRRVNDEMPIHVAAMVGAADAVEAILEHDKQQVNATGREGRFPLDYACHANRLNVAKVLVTYSANVNQLPSLSNMGPLHHAAANGNAEMIQLLIDAGADCNLLSRTKLTPLQYCLNSARPSLIEATASMLIKNGADVNQGNPSLLQILEDREGLPSEIKAAIKELLISHDAAQEAKKSDLTSGHSGR